MAYVVIWTERGADSGHCRVFHEESSAAEAAGRLKADGCAVTVVNTQWNGRGGAIQDAPAEAGVEDEAASSAQSAIEFAQGG